MKIVVNEVKNNGFIYEEDKPKDFILGANSPLDEPPIQFESGHGWAGYRSKPEMQFNPNFDTFSCTVYGTAKSLVAYLKKVYGIETTVSEMYNAYFAGVVPNRGTSVRSALESFRNYGWVTDAEYPFTKDITASQFFKMAPKQIILKAKGKLTLWDVHWEAIETSGNISHSTIKNALKRTPVLATGYAWASYYGEGVYNSYNNNPNHLFMIDDFADEPKYDLIAYDSYPQDNKFDEDSKEEEFVKKLSRDYRVWSAHRIWLTPTDNNNKISIKYIINMLKKIARSIHGSFFFVKDVDGVPHKQEITNWKAMLGSIVDEIGVEKNNLTNEELNKMPNFEFFK